MIAVRVLQGLCLLLGLLAASEAAKLVRNRDGASAGGVSLAPAVRGAGDRSSADEVVQGEGGEGDEAGAAEGMFPARYAVIASSGIFGKAEEKPPSPPTLVGLMGGLEKKYALLRGSGGKEFRIAEGEESNGVELLRIGRNRVLIEHAGRRLELTLFEGLGGATLLAPAPNAESEAEKGTPRDARPEEPPR